MSIERWDTHEVVLESKTGYANPFRDVALSARFVHQSSGRVIEVDGFYDGDQTWRLRFMPTELGAWTYATESADPALSGHSGSVECVAPARPHLRGPLRCDGFHFVHADGTRRFLTSTRLSCQFASQDVWARVIRYLREYQINRVFFMLGGIRGTFKDLFGEGPDFERFDLARFRAVDGFIDALRQADILAAPYFYYFNDGLLRDLTIEQDRAYVRYGMARFGAYANVLPVLSNEVEQKYTLRHATQTNDYDIRSREWANEMGTYLASRSVFGAPVTVHNPMENFAKPGFYALLRDWSFPWADYMLRQAQVGALGAAEALRDDIPEDEGAVYGERAYARHNQLLIDLRRYGIPVVNEEPGYEMGGGAYDGDGRVSSRSWNTQTASRFLRTLWTAVAAGGYAAWGNPATYELGDPVWGLRDSVVPLYLRVLNQLMSRLPYWEMEPSNELVSAGEATVSGVAYRTNFCLAKPGQRYLSFSLWGGDVSLELRPGARYQLTHFDPRTGEEVDLGQAGAGVATVRLPGRDLVLLASAER